MAVRSMGGRDDLLRKRIQQTFWLVLLCYLGVMARLLYLQGVQGDALRAQARKPHRIPIRVLRGTLLDRNGNPLAMDEYIGNVTFDPGVTMPEADPRIAKRQAKQLQQTIERAALILRMPRQALANKVNTARVAWKAGQRKRNVVIRRGISSEMARAIRTAKPHLMGFGVEDRYRRFYASGRNAAQAVGFLNQEGQGAAGLEKVCDRWLQGVEGYVLTELDGQGREIPGTRLAYQPARDSQNVHTTLDAEVQEIATQEAARTFQEFLPESVSVTIVEPKTGDVLGMVSYPAFDPGNRLTLQGSAMRECVIADDYEPGSTMKTLTLAAAFEERILSEHSTYICNGGIKIGGGTIRCAHNARHDAVTPSDILRQSCNIATAQIGLTLGAKRLEKWSRRFGLLDRTGVEFPREASGAWTKASALREDPYSRGRAARVAFGQAMTTSPLHMTMAYAALANDGVLMRPRLLTKVTDRQGQVVQEWQPTTVRRVVSTKTAHRMQQMLRRVVSEGTARVCAMPGYQVSGKTGTTYDYRPGYYIGSFAGLVSAAPGSTPRAAILVVVKYPRNKKYYGGDVAAPAFRNIAHKLLELWQVPEDDPEDTQYKASQERRRTRRTR